MISNHYPMTYAGPYGWLVLAFIALAGVLVRRFYVLTHARRFVIALPVAAALVLVVVAIAIAPRTPTIAAGASPSFATAQTIVAERCAVCHSAHPAYAGFGAPPEGVLLDTPEHIIANAARIEEQAVRSKAMPLGNVTHITEAERAQLGAWIDGGAKGP
jgi:uncharacterized membrane protein